MPSPRTKPSLTSLVAFFLFVLPLVYALSYAPVVRVRGDLPAADCIPRTSRLIG